MYKKEIPIIIEHLQKGNTILYPTDTIWGIGCDASNSEAIDKIFTIKNRKPEQKFIVLVENLKMLQCYVEGIPQVIVELLEQSLSPTTIIYPKGINLAANAYASDGSIAIRIPKDDFCIELIKQFGKPIISTSANFHGEKSPCCFMEINLELIKTINYAVNYKQQDAKSNITSKIYKLNTDNNIVKIR